MKVKQMPAEGEEYQAYHTNVAYFTFVQAVNISNK
jgi:hypothetical protein